MARPSEYDPKLCDLIIPLFEQGMSRSAVAKEVGKTTKTLHTYVEKHPEFAEAWEWGLTLAEAWWEEQGRLNLENKQFNTTMWYMNMKNRWKWRDTHDVTSGDEPLKQPEIAIRFIDSDQ